MDCDVVEKFIRGLALGGYDFGIEAGNGQTRQILFVFYEKAPVFLGRRVSSLQLQLNQMQTCDVDLKSFKDKRLGARGVADEVVCSGFINF